MSNYSVLSKSENPYTNSYNPGYNSHKAYMKTAMNPNNPAQQAGGLQTAAKCPHGFPGTCPICMGKTGGGGGNTSETRKRTGMSWSEAYYVYNMIQKNKLAAREDKQLTQMAIQRLKVLEKIQSSTLYQNLIAIKNRAMELTEQLQQTVLQFGHKVVKTVVNPLIETLNKVVNALKFTVTTLIGVVNKLTAQIGEKLKKIQETIKDNIKKLIARLRETTFLSRLIAVYNEKRQLFRDLLLRKTESLKEKILKFTTPAAFISEENPDKQQKKNRNKSEKKKQKRELKAVC